MTRYLKSTSAHLPTWPLLFLTAMCKDWEEDTWLSRRLEQPSAQRMKQELHSCPGPAMAGATLLVLLNGCSLPPPPAASASLQALTALLCSSTQLCCSVGSIPGCLGHGGSVAGPRWLQGGQWAGGYSSWRAIPDSRQVDGAAGGQHQTGSRWRGQQEGNTTLYSTWH